MKLIKEIHKNWKPLTEEQKLFKGCKLFTGKESFDEIASLLLSPQGLEFCLKNSFPALEYFERFDKEMAADKGIYINAGDIELTNHETVLLVGETDAILNYNNVEKAYKVIVMHTATAEIHASNYAVVFKMGDEDNFLIKADNNSIVK